MMPKEKRPSESFPNQRKRQRANRGHSEIEISNENDSFAKMLRGRTRKSGIVLTNVQQKIFVVLLLVIAASAAVFVFKPNVRGKGFTLSFRKFSSRPCVKSIVGIFSVVTSPAEKQFRRWLKPIVNNSNTLSCGLNFVFVYGNNAQKLGGRVILNISANMNDRKSFEWIKYAHTNYEADYIFKMDTDTNICLRNLESELEGAFEDACDYIGKKMDHNSCAKFSHCPPRTGTWAYMWSGKRAYMSGFFYGISKSFAKKVTKFGKRTDSFEDLDIGKLLYGVGTPSTCELKGCNYEGLSYGPVCNSMAHFNGMKKGTLFSKELCPPTYLTAKIIGGLGNQMWIYQSVHGIARYNDKLAAFDINEIAELNRTFDLSQHIFRIRKKESYQHGGIYDNFESIPKVDKLHHVEIGNYLQNAKFFEPLGTSFKAFYNIRPYFLDLAKVIVPKNSVCIHRRYFPDNHNHNVCPSSQAMQYFLNSIPAGKHVLVFSNDLARARKEMIAKNITFVDNGPVDLNFRNVQEKRPTNPQLTSRDFAALTICDNLVVTCGTFGGFAGILHSGNGKVFYFNDPKLLKSVGESIISTWVSAEKPEWS